MRARRFLALMVAMTAAGVCLSRLDGVTPTAFRFVSPIFAQQAPQADSKTASSELPGFVPQALSKLFLSTPDSEADDVPAAPAYGAAAYQTLAATPLNPVAPATKPHIGAQQPIVRFEPIPSEALPQSGGSQAEPDGRPGAQAALPPSSEPQSSRLAQPVIPAKAFFGSVKKPAPLPAQAIGSYAHGCLAGATALPTDGPAWQGMRLSRNRNWGHPKLIALIEKFATDAQKFDGWPGLLVGDISQPRGGPMLTGHASHQIGLDADVWLTPMPNRRLTAKEREEINATSMLDSTDIAVDPKVFTEDRVKLIKRAASYHEVERVLVHPAIKKALCKAAGTDRGWLAKVRPIAGHYYHFHIRLSCPAGSPGCEPQKAPPGDDGCGKEVEEALAAVTPYKGPPIVRPPGWKPPPPKPQLTLASLPSQCTAVLQSGPDGVAVPPAGKIDLKAIARAPAALKPHLRKLLAASAAESPAPQRR